MLRNWLTLTLQDLLATRSKKRIRKVISRRQPVRRSEAEFLETRALLSAVTWHGTFNDQTAAGAIVQRSTHDGDNSNGDQNRSGGSGSSNDGGNSSGSNFGGGDQLNGQGLQFNFNPASGMSQQAIDGFQEAANLWSSILTDDIVINMDIDFRTLGGGILGQASSATQSTSYADYRTALIGDSLSASDAIAVANLPDGPDLSIFTSAAGNASDTLDDNNSVNNRFLSLNQTTAKAVGLRAPDNGVSDASIAFNTSFTWDFDRSNGITGGAFDFVGVAAHEIGHALGFRSGVDTVDRTAGTGQSVDGFAIATGLDIFRFSNQSVAAGADIDMQAGTDVKFFSIDGGATSLTTFSQGRVRGDGQQASHWKDNLGIGIMDPTAAPGEYADITEFDVQAMDVTGWDVVHDFGDAPDTSAGTSGGDYQTTLENNGPRHDLFAASNDFTDPSGRPKVFLGTGTTRDFVAQTNGDATADSDDGVVIPDLLGGTTVSATVTSTGGKLDYFVDFNADGDFDDTGESFSATVRSGNTTVDIVVPDTVADGNTIARFRLSTAGGLGALGPAADGEVEDYQVNLLKAPVELYLNEILVDPASGSADNPNEYVELRGDANKPLDDIYLVFLESDSGGSLGSINNGTTNIVSLNGFQLGSNGYAVIVDEQDHPYSIAAGTTIIDVADLDIEDASWTAMLIETSPGASVPSNQDLDVDDNGLDRLPSGWKILDSVAVLDGGVADRGYSSIVFSADGDGNSESGGTVVDVGVDADRIQHIMRVGDTTGQEAADWVAFEHNASTSAAPDWRILTSSNPAYSARNVITNHLGATNPIKADSIEPEINVQFDSVDIVDGDTTPSVAEGTDFGFVLTSSGSKTRTYTVQNTGLGPLDVSGVTVAGAEAADFTISNFSAGSLAVNASMTFDLTFDPSADGVRSATIEIASDDLDESSYNFDVVGEGTPVLAPEIQVIGLGPIADGDTTPDTADGTDFGILHIDNRSRTRTFTVVNVGSAALDVSAVSITGIQAADFTVSNFTARTIPVDGQLTFDVTFDPSAEGSRLATIEIVSDDSDENPYDFAIAGYGVTQSVLTTLVFNELLADSSGLTASFDTNGDGSAETGDQFIELFNTSGNELNVGGLEFWDSTGTNYFTVPHGTLLGPSGHLVIVNSVEDGSLPDVPAGSLAFDANGSMTLLEDGDSLVIYDVVSDEFVQATFNGATATDPAANYSGFSDSATILGTVLDLGTDTDGTSRALSPDGDTSSILDHNKIGNTSIVATPGNANVAPGNASDTIVLSEIMYNPDSSDGDWEWIELANTSGIDVFIGDWVIDDDNPVAHAAANIGAGFVPANGTAVLYDADSITADGFEAAWGFGINMIPVTNWAAMSLSNSGDTIGLWENFTDYTGDHQAHANVAWTVDFDDNDPWPRDDGKASIFLTDLTADFSDGANWALSTVGTATPAGGSGYSSRALNGNDGEDVGSPGGAFPGLTVVINDDEILESIGNAATTVTITRTGRLTSDLTVTLLSDDTTEADLQSTVVIPAGDAAVKVNLDAIDDALIDGTQLVTITASAAGLDDGSDTVNVLDNDSNALIVDVASDTVSESDGPAATTVTIRRNDTAGNVTVTLQSTDTTEATVPATVVIPDGQTSVTVDLDAIDDDLLDGDQTVTITASATGFTGGSIDVSVTDDEFLTSQLLLNEVMIHPNDLDTGNEYIELRGTPNGFLPADAYVLLIEGDASNQGVLDHRFDIGGLQFGSNGYLVLLQAGNTFTVDPDSAVFTATGTGWGTDFSSRSSDIEDGSLTALIVQSSSVPAVEVDFDSNNDGSLDGAASAWTIVDGFGILDGGTTDTAYGLINASSNGQGLTPTGSTFFTLNGFHSGYAGRIGDSTDSTSADWVFAEVEGGSPSYLLSTSAVVPSHLGGAAMNHIGSTNDWTPPVTLKLSIAAVEILENGGQSSATLQRTSGDISADLVVTLNSNDTSEASVPATVTIPAGSSSVTFDVTAVDDAIADGTQTATISASATGFAAASDVIDILDDDSSGFAIVESDGNTEVSESGTTDTFTVVLNSEPTSDVVFTVTASDLTEAASSPATLTFTSANWATPQTVTVTGIDDAEDDGDQVSTITISVDDAASDDSFDNLDDQTVSVTTLDDDESFSVIISEIMFNPASSEDDWEWIELFNTTDASIDLTGWVLDDNDNLGHTSSNIAGGILAAESTGVLFNADDVALVDFQAAWGVGINLIPVTNWAAFSLGNSSDTLGLWDSFSNYDGDNVDQTKTAFSVTYQDTGDWPTDDGFASIFLTDLAADTSEGNNWALSTDGAASPAGGSAYTSRMVGGNSGSDIGSPGGSFVGLTVEIGADSVAEDAGNSATQVTITRSGDVSTALTVALTSSDITEAKIVGSVLIPAGAASVSVDLEAVDDALVDGNQVATITASAAGLDDGSDSVIVIDNDAPTLTVIIAKDSMSENGGSTTATLFRNTDTTAELIVNLSSDDLSEATVPATVTIPAGQESVTFVIDAVDDAIVDGTQTVSITASLAGFAGSVDSIDVTDDDVATLSITIDPNSISENGGTATGTVTRNIDTTDPLVVNLSSDDTTEASVDATVTIPAGQASMTFTITAVDDEIVDGIQTATITGTATGFVDATSSVDVTDDDVATLTLVIDADSISENAGTTTGTITRNTDTTDPLVVNIQSDDTTEAAVPMTVTIPAGQASMNFTINAVDDEIVDGTQTATVSVSSSGFATGSDTVDVTDDDVATLSITIDPTSISENGGTATGTVTRNTDTTAALEVSLNSNDTTEAAVPMTVTIPAGQASMTFTINAVDDTIVDGTQTATITGTATGFVDATSSVDVTDDDVATLTLVIDADSISENAGTTTGTITRNTDTTDPLVVNIQSDDTTEAAVPMTVTIPAGQASMNFTINAVDDEIVDGTQTATITGTATTFADASDAIDVTDDDVATLTLTIDADSISENGGTATGTITRNTDTTAALVVNLSSDDTSEANVPATVTIPAGQTSMTFTINAVDDTIVDGTQTATITGTATTFADASDAIDVTDDDVATLTLTIDAAAISENGGTATGTVTRNTDTTAALVVDLSSDDTSEANVPATVTIPAGQTSMTFTINAVDDTIVDGTQTATITAMATTFADASDAIDVTDDDGSLLTLAIDSTSISENGGSATGTITRNTDTTDPLVVNLSSDDTTEAAVPATVTIPAGQTSMTFVINAVDDAIVDGTQTANITGTSTGFVDANNSIDVTDDDVSTLTLVIDADSISENGGTATGTITRNTDTTDPLVVNVESDDTTEAAVPATVTIPAGQTSMTFTINAVDDAIVDGTQTATITAMATTFADASDAIDVTDDDSAGFSVTETDGSTVVSETGTTDTFDVVLTAAPVSPVTFIIATNDSSETTATPPLVVFNSSNWNTPQTVTVTGVDDSLLDGTQTSTITIAVDDGNSDDAFDALADQTVSVDTLDDEKVTASISRIQHAQEDLETPGIFRIDLSDAPLVATNITYSVTGTASNGTDYTLLTGTLTAAAGLNSIDLPVMTIDDNLDEISETVTITLTGGDINVDPAASSETLLIIDNDVSEIVSSRTSLSVSEDGTSETFDVTLSSRPTADVTITVQVSDTTEASSSHTSLTFTPSNWNMAQTVTITGVDDAVVDGDIMSEVILSTDAAAPGNYASAEDVSIVVTTDDNDSNAALATINSVTFFNKDAEAERNLSLDQTGQRSMVRRVEIVLDGIKTVSSATGFSAVNRSTSANVGLAFVSSTITDNQTILVLEFTSELDPGTRANATAQPASLKDGLYRFTIDGTAAGIDVTGSGTASGTANFEFHRLFGDSDGDRDVDGLDFALYRQAFTGTSPLDAVFDYDNDGQLFRDLDDLTAFRNRYGRRI